VRDEEEDEDHEPSVFALASSGELDLDMPALSEFARQYRSPMPMPDPRDQFFAQPSPQAAARGPRDDLRVATLHEDTDPDPDDTDHHPRDGTHPTPSASASSYHTLQHTIPAPGTRGLIAAYGTHYAAPTGALLDTPGPLTLVARSGFDFHAPNAASEVPISLRSGRISPNFGDAPPPLVRDASSGADSLTGNALDGDAALLLEGTGEERK
jgi:hypothetical protein